MPSTKPFGSMEYHKADPLGITPVFYGTGGNGKQFETDH